MQILTDCLLAKLREFSRDELVQLKAEAKRNLQIHKSNSQGECFGGVQGYLTIKCVEDEVVGYKAILEAITVIEQEWQETLARGRYIRTMEQAL